MMAAFSICVASTLLLHAEAPKTFRHPDGSVKGFTMHDLSEMSPTGGLPPGACTVTFGDRTLKIGGEEFRRGLSMPAGTLVSYDLGGVSTMFEAVVGVDDSSRIGGPVTFRVLADGREAGISKGLSRGDKGEELVVAGLAGVTNITLQVVGTAGVKADWGDAIFHFKKGEHPPCGIRASTRQLGILTPRPSAAPRINGRTVYGVRPGSPVVYRLPVTGERPMTLKADNLPEGLAFDAATGIVTGSLAARGEYPVAFTAANAKGTAARTVRFVVGDEICLTPAMGWNSWNAFAGSVSDKNVRAAADAMVSSGLADHGWCYIVIDDCWNRRPKLQLNDKDADVYAPPTRDEGGTMRTNAKFPDMKALFDYVHGLGLKTGIYSSPGPTSCGGCEGSWQHEAQDAKTFADWGCDYLKFDLCSGGGKGFGKGWRRYLFLYRIMGQELRSQDRDIVYSLCEYGIDEVPRWGRLAYGHSWRTTWDIFDSWASITGAIEAQKPHFMFSGVGAYNDPDMLCVGGQAWAGKSRLSPNEQYSHISLWVLINAPLMIGCNMENMDELTLSLLTNDEVLDVSQDPLCAGAGCVDEGEGWEIWARPLADGSIAAGLYNRSLEERDIVLDMDKLGLECKWKVRDLWRQQDVGVAMGSYAASVPGHATHFVRLTPLACGRLRRGMADIRDNAWNLLRAKAQDGRL